ncbi:DNA topoisomerase IV subunit A [Alkalicoccus urumqiensis]|uniref:DNA topoisomerase 4 subunit A n=1 Tax=Alkalicoccus urumqiensis TaxID=1548213 RepID=A0A2P6ML24_ALKUR|nr:DNA topoisomerase IV subunit A [Alkalicoccus urumqiensis]PRO66964.1 DNA topoisomerase IV subunit A [Alkalicoccus urumqiensis]
MAQKERYLDMPLEEILGDRFGRYSKYIIQDRALPDARDGLKPVQRRILFAMYTERNTSDKPFRKSAKTVGNVIGNYHPHGDSSVYEAMIRQSQDWKMRVPLVEMHGNNGSVDGDPPAAMRYTEARLARHAEEMLQDIQKDTVDFMPNFDDSQEEPVVLPAAFPNLLINGSTGISSGYATDIPPHNPGEVIDAAIAQIDRPDIPVEQLMTYIQGPDFPTGGIIQGEEGIKNAYEKGRGKVVVRGKADIQTVRGGRRQIVIEEIPFEINKASLVKKMDELRIDKKVDGIAEVRDETDRTGMRIVIELKKEADAQGVLHFLYKNTDLQTAFNFNMVAIADKTPTLMTLPKLLDAFIQHQKEVIVRRSRFELNKARDRAHIVEGLMKAVSILDDVIAEIRRALDKQEAKTRIEKAFGFSEKQSEAIVNLQLYRLTNTDIETLEKEQNELHRQIAQLEELLSSEKKLKNQMKKELRSVRKLFSTERLTAVEAEIEEIKIDLEVMVPSEDVRVSLTKEGYLKRSSLRSFIASNGEQPAMKESDRMLFNMELNTTDTLLVFTASGSYLYIPVHLIPEMKWKDSGQHIANIVQMTPDDKVVDTAVVTDFSKEDRELLFLTKNGMIKRTPLQEYKAQRHSKALMAVKLKKEDELTSVRTASADSDVICITHQGYGLRFGLDDVSATGIRTSGMKAVNLKDSDFCRALVAASTDKDELILCTQRAAVKKMPVSELEKQARAGRGVRVLKELKKQPHRIMFGGVVPDNTEIVIITADQSETTRRADALRTSDRYQNGSFLVDTAAHGEVHDVFFRSVEGK